LADPSVNSAEEAGSFPLIAASTFSIIIIITIVGVVTSLNTITAMKT